VTLALLITGAKGQLGGEIVAQARRSKDVMFAKGIDIEELDLTDPFDVRDYVQEWVRVVRSDSPNHQIAIINPAAYTAVDKAEEQEELAFAVNAAAPALLATACAAAGVRLIQVSTDYVFPGDGTVPYEPSDPTGPRSAYGRTKLAGEQAVRELLPELGYVVRTAWLYGGGGPNFVKTMVRLEKMRDTVSVVTDQVGSPTWAADLASGLISLARSEAPAGIYHGTGLGATTWFGLTQAIFEELGADPARVLPTDSGAFVQAAARPSYSVLSPKAWDDVGLPPFPAWRESLAEAFRVEGDALRSG
jgi:dTDP-4-dehydrorhamnose reductase